jgi:hypothetical protein
VDNASEFIKTVNDFRRKRNYSRRKAGITTFQYLTMSNINIPQLITFLSLYQNTKHGMNSTHQKKQNDAILKIISLLRFDCEEEDGDINEEKVDFDQQGTDWMFDNSHVLNPSTQFVSPFVTHNSSQGLL